MILTICAWKILLTSQRSNLETLDLIMCKIGGIVDLLKVNVGIGIGLGHLDEVCLVVGVNPVGGLSRRSSAS